MTDPKQPAAQPPKPAALVATPKRTRMIARRDLAVKVELTEEQKKEHLEQYGKVLPQTRVVKPGEEFECTEEEAREFEKPFDGYFTGAGHLHKFQADVTNERLVRAERVVAEGRKAS